MNVPTSVRINGVEYAVIEVDNLNNGINLAYGNIDYEENVIRINKDRNIDHQKKCLILLHEIMHGICEARGLDLGTDEEKIVDAFARGVYQVIEDNAPRFFKEEKNDVHRKSESKNRRAAT